MKKLLKGLFVICVAFVIVIAPVIMAKAAPARIYPCTHRKDDFTELYVINSIVKDDTTRRAGTMYYNYNVAKYSSDGQLDDATGNAYLSKSNFAPGTRVHAIYEGEDDLGNNCFTAAVCPTPAISNDDYEPQSPEYPCYAKEGIDFIGSLSGISEDSTQTVNYDFNCLTTLSAKMVETMSRYPGVTWNFTMIYNPHRQSGSGANIDTKYRIVIPAGYDLNSLIEPGNGFAGVLYLNRVLKGTVIEETEGRYDCCQDCEIPFSCHNASSRTN